VGAPDAVLELIERFKFNRDQYLNPAYNETQVRREFLDPFFTALGWDVDNRAGHAQQYKDVVHEDAIKVGLDARAPDYSFRIGGQRKFFVEAKKPAVNLRDDPAPAFQLRRYAWSAKLPLSVLTDFQELAVYDGSVKPSATDKPSMARTLYVPYERYDTHWDEIAEVFSKEAILRGSFDRYAESTKSKKGTAEVDKAFLGEIELWRDALARNIARRNPALSQRELNFAVQVTIDRIIFLRICEDRGIEAYGRLQGLMNGGNTYGRLKQLFWEADQRYNSGLFHFADEKGRSGYADRLTPELTIDGKVLKDILRRLYYPESPYEFSVLPADILGQVYEQFLGKVIRLTPGHRAVVEDKPEVKKAGGVFYTPTYIVDYVVETTIGRLLEGKAPKVAAELRVLDPACGSGSFLIGAYQYLLDWHRNWYVGHGPEKHRKELYLGSGGDWHLTSAEKKRILLNNIFGVDIDAQAVETTKLSLLLKVLEDESAESLDAQLSFLHERALPDLAANIKCGNSLVGSDFYDDAQLGLSVLDEEERYRVNVFDWEAQFPSILGSTLPVGERGFDAVIGNPPYIRMEQFKLLKKYLKAHFTCHDERSDLYAYFMERGHRLLAPNGRFGMIVSNKFLRAKYGAPLRRLLATEFQVERVVDFAGLPVFKGATVRTLVVVSTGAKGGGDALYSPPPSRARFVSLAGGSATVGNIADELAYGVDLPADESAWTLLPAATQGLLNRLTASCSSTLADYSGKRIWMGVKSGLSEAFVINDATRLRLLAGNPEAAEVIKPFVVGRDVRRYRIGRRDEYLLYMFHGIDAARYPAVIEHLRPYRARLEKRATEQAWYELQQPQYRFSSFMAAPKIIFPDIAKGPRFALDTEGCFGSNTVYFIPMEDHCLLGLLNSALGRFYFRSACAGLEGGDEVYLRFFGQYMEGFPMPSSVGDLLAGKSGQALDSLVKSRMQLEAQLAVARMPQAAEELQRETARVDAGIDRLVYDLYGLTDDEVTIVEEGAATGS
jgi:hypothetical protein